MNASTRTTSAARALAALLVGSLPLTLGACAASRPIEKLEGSLYQTVEPGSHPVLTEVLKQAADRAPIGVTLDPDAADYHLRLGFNVRDKGLHDMEAVWTMTTVLLLTVYPSTCAHFELTLSGDLFDPTGRRLKSWSIVEQDTAFLWLFQGDSCGSEPAPESLQKAATKMLDRLYAQMSRDGAFFGKRLRPIDSYPLVYVDVVNARELVEKVLKTAEPFPNYTTDAGQAAAAERVLRIEFEFLKADQGVMSMGNRVGAAIMTLGLVSVCSRNTMVLNAEMLGNDGSVIRRYQLKDKKRASMMNDCAPPTDETHPELARKLLKKLLVELKKDTLA